jgi:hypothetical protein
MDDARQFQRRTLFCKTDHKATQGFVERRELPFPERLRNTVKITGGLLVAAVIGVFIPFLHFVLVPVLLLCCLIFGVATWLEKAEILRGEYTCPECGKLNSLARESENFPRATRCQHCYLTLNLSLNP